MQLINDSSLGPWPTIKLKKKKLKLTGIPKILKKWISK